MPRDLSYPPLPEPLSVGTYDNHTHLDLEGGDDRLDYREQLDRASSVGIRGIVQVGTDVASSRWAAETAAIEPRMLAAVAIHPNDAAVLAASGTGELDDAIAVIADLAGRPRVRAIGETGIDHFRTTDDDGRAAQLRAFEAHIEIAKQDDLALQIHDRNAHAEVVSALMRLGAPERTVFHCFSGDRELVEICARHGWYMSFAGNVTFKNAGMLRDALAAAPRELLMVETDAPFLTPEPNRGRTNAPYLVPYTLRAMADQLHTDPETLAERITANTEAVYGRWDSEPAAAKPPAATTAAAEPTAAEPPATSDAQTPRDQPA